MDLNSLISDRMIGKSERTIEIYTHWLTRFDGWLRDAGGELDQLTRADVQQFLDWLAAKKMAPSTIAVVISAIRRYAQWTNQEHSVANLRTIRPPKITEIAPKSLERTEWLRVLREVERDGNHRDIAMIYVFLYCGLRVSELCALDRSDLEIGERSGYVRVRHGKRGKARIVQVPSEARHHLAIYIKGRTDELEPLFISNFNRRISVRSVERIVGRYGVHPHVLRHTYARTLVGAGVDLAIVAEALGHADINMTRRYAKPTNEEVVQAVEEAFIKP